MLSKCSQQEDSRLLARNLETSSNVQALLTANSIVRSMFVCRLPFISSTLNSRYPRPNAIMLAKRPSPILAFVGFVLIILLLLSTASYHEKFSPLSFRGGQAAVGQISVSTNGRPAPPPNSHNEVFSVSRKDGQYWPIDFGGFGIINPNMIPHPNKTDVWIVVAQRMDPPGTAYGGQWSVEITCEAIFQNGALTCVEKPEILPISATPGGNCVGDITILNMNIGPHDARVFYGPESPFIVFGSNSQFTCFGQWIQDFRPLINWPFLMWVAAADRQFLVGKELQRPRFGPVEKNWFIFWDAAGDMYVHHDISPKRSFVRVGEKGMISEDLAPLVASDDEKCMAAYMPVPGKDEELHQATNSLAIVLCRREDPECNVEAKTYIMHIYQHKLWHGFHGVYEPYVVLMHRTAPFGIYGLTKKPFWIRGRGGPGRGRIPKFYDAEMRKSWNQSEMVYITSMNWKEQGRNYVGYLDDVLMLGFGIEDRQSAVMDVTAGDLLKNLGLCSEL
ncbi:hypothetical protein BGZ57DRAFT_913293 [Hyaloscypha finlandica]|nr:hypothetical protein BGZ57DRAFT_913293 [Hyaloscypha finlandica]